MYRDYKMLNNDLISVIIPYLDIYGISEYYTLYMVSKSFHKWVDKFHGIRNKTYNELLQYDDQYMMDCNYMELLMLLELKKYAANNQAKSCKLKSFIGKTHGNYRDREINKPTTIVRAYTYDEAIVKFLVYCKKHKKYHFSDMYNYFCSIPQENLHEMYSTKRMLQIFRNILRYDRESSRHEYQKIEYYYGSYLIECEEIIE
jgi:hypothetical protein